MSAEPKLSGLSRKLVNDGLLDEEKAITALKTAHAEKISFTQYLVNNTACYSSPPITAQAGLRVRKLALHSNRSYCYAFRSRAAPTNTNPAHAPVILMRNTG